MTGEASFHNQRITRTNRCEPLRHAKGAAIVELAIIIPLIIIIGFSAIEVSNILRLHEMGQLVSREGAMRAYRQCSGLRFPGAKIQECMDLQQARMLALASQIAPGSHVFLFVAQQGQPSVQSPLVATAPDTSHALINDSTNGYLKDYLADQIGSPLARQKGGAGGDALASAQVWLPYTPLVPFIAKFFGISSNFIYDSTII